MGNAINSLLFQPPEPSYHADPNLIWLNTRRGERIPCFFIDRKSPLTILFSHGNAEDLGLIHQYFESVCPRLDCNIFAYDYTGYGHASGQPSEDDIYADIEAAFLYLRDVLGIPWTNIVLFGRSLGSAATTHLASLTPVRGVVLQCPMLSVFRIGFNARLSLPGDMLKSVDRMSLIESPVLIIHGEKDEVVPFWHGVDLFNLCKDKRIEPYWVPGGDHNNLESAEGPTFWTRVSEFLKFLRTNDILPELKNQPIRI
jgi:pimeloyl-ACP methyl ester carboxylesterase